MEQSKLPILLVPVIILFIILISFIIRETTPSLGVGDSDIYLTIAENPFDFICAPQGYRIFVPYLAAFISWITSCTLPLAFTILSTILFVLINVIIILWFYKYESLPLISACLLSLLYSFSYAGTYNLHNVIHPGFGEHLVVLLGFIAIRRRQFIPLLFIILIGSFVKETIIILAAVYFVYEWKRQPFKALILNTFILVGTGLTSYVFIRSGLLYKQPYEMPIFGADESYFDYVSAHRLTFLVYLKLIFRTFHVIWLIAVIGLLKASREFRPLFILVIISILQIAIAVDIERMVAIGFPAILFYCGVVYKSLSLKCRGIITLIGIAVFYVIIIISNSIIRYSLIGLSFLFILYFYWFICRYKKNLTEVPVELLL